MDSDRYKYGSRWLWYTDTSQPMHKASMCVIREQDTIESAALTFGVDPVKLATFVPDHIEYLEWLDNIEVGIAEGEKQ